MTAFELDKPWLPELVLSNNAGVEVDIAAMMIVFLILIGCCKV